MVGIMHYYNPLILFQALQIFHKKHIFIFKSRKKVLNCDNVSEDKLFV